jgi:hypothetical protein
MTPEVFEQDVRSQAGRFSFIQAIVTLDRTANTVKLRLEITAECFVQVYANVRKGLTSYTLVLRQSRLYGRNNDGTGWHRHPHTAPDDHDFSDEGSRPVTLTEFLEEVQRILTLEGIL